MELTNGQQPEREVQWAQASRDELVDRIRRAVPDDGTAEPLARADAPPQLDTYTAGAWHVLPAFCVIAQGSKEILLGDTRYRYDPAHYLITTAELQLRRGLRRRRRNGPISA